jgi:hypothetical protein
MFDFNVGAGLGQVLGAKGGAVVRQQPFDLYAERLVVGHGVTHELHSTGLGFIGVHVGEANARMIVDGDKQKFPASAVAGIRRLGAQPVDAPEPRLLRWRLIAFDHGPPPLTGGSVLAMPLSDDERSCAVA